MSSIVSAVLTAPRQFELQLYGPQPIQPRQVRVRLEGCGVCASSLPLWSGRSWFTYPCPAGVPGHEGWGEVLECGAEVIGLPPGQRVAVLCDHAFSSEVVVPADRVCAISFQGPFPGEAFACAYNIFDRAHIDSQDVVVIVGSGFLGGALIQLAQAVGAKVFAVSRRDHSLQLASAVGASAVLRAGPNTVEQLQQQNDGRLADVVIECGGVQETLDLAGSLLRSQGRLVIAGFHQDGLRSVDLGHWNWQAFTLVNAHERDPARLLWALRRAASAIEQGHLDPDPLLTHHLTIDRLSDAFDLLENRPDGFVKATVSL